MPLLIAIENSIRQQTHTKYEFKKKLGFDI